MTAFSNTITHNGTGLFNDGAASFLSGNNALADNDTDKGGTIGVFAGS